MKFSPLACLCFTLCVCLIDAKDVRQISSLVPLEDWLDFKNRTKDVKPLDKIIGKLRATYDFVFHRAENVSNVGKILGTAARQNLDDVSKINFNETFFPRVNVSELVEMIPLEGKMSSGYSHTGSENSNKSSLGESSERNLDELEQGLPLSRLEILDDESTDNFDTDTLDSTRTPYHSKFRVPYAIAQAFLRWLISIYYAAHATATPNDPPLRESA